MRVRYQAGRMWGTARDIQCSNLSGTKFSWERVKMGTESILWCPPPLHIPSPGPGLTPQPVSKDQQGSCQNHHQPSSSPPDHRNAAFLSDIKLGPPAPAMWRYVQFFWSKTTHYPIFVFLLTRARCWYNVRWPRLPLGFVREGHGVTVVRPLSCPSRSSWDWWRCLA